MKRLLSFMMISFYLVGCSDITDLNNDYPSIEQEIDLSKEIELTEQRMNEPYSSWPYAPLECAGITVSMLNNCLAVMTTNSAEIYDAFINNRPDGRKVTKCDLNMLKQLDAWTALYYRENPIKNEDIIAGGIACDGYGIEELLGLTITADTQLFNKPAGEDITEMFEIALTSGSKNSARLGFYYFFTNDKKIHTANPSGKSVKEFLSYHPMISNVICLRFKQRPSEQTTDIQYTVTMTVKGKGTFTASSPKISL